LVIFFGLFVYRLGYTRAPKYPANSIEPEILHWLVICLVCSPDMPVVMHGIFLHQTGPANRYQTHFLVVTIRQSIQVTTSVLVYGSKIDGQIAADMDVLHCTTYAYVPPLHPASRACLDA